MKATALLVGTVTVAGAIVIPLAAASAAPAHEHKSSTFAGYEVSMKVSTATATLVVPTITCKKNFSGVGPTIIVQSRVDKKTNSYTNSGGGVGVVCEKKQAVYDAVLIVDGAETNVPGLAPGDHVAVSVTEKKSKTVVTVNDVTSSFHKTIKGKGAVGATAYFGDEGVAISKKSVGIDPFTKTAFTDSLVDGKTLKAVHAFPVRRFHKSTLEIGISALTKGKDFALIYKHG
jgi:hypothetical protein